jgi:hypothetical protein
MDRAEALRAVKKLEAVAQRATHPGEAEAARNRASHLRAKFHLSDSDVANASADGYAQFNYYSLNLATINGIKATLDSTKRKLDTLSPYARAHAAVRLYKELRELLETDRYSPNLKAWRDEAIKAWYQDGMDEHLNRWHKFDDEPTPGRDEIDILHEQIQAHDLVIMGMSDQHLHKDTIERIVGVSHKALWRKYWELAQQKEEANNVD